MKVETTVRDYRPMIDKKVRKYIEESDVFVHGIGAGNTLIPKGGCEECDCNAFKLLIIIF